ncbi:MAG: 3-dehydro-L-gulonate 2-dehydrogenase [Caldilineaceae bacterium]|nr:3-dehydro-L-gulonate 2-dehydrogenase [Caldilineaceae bacterium]
MRIALETMQEQFTRVLLNYRFTPKRAARCAAIFAENSLVGVLSHGVNRFPGFIDFIRKGYVDPTAEPELVAALGAWEQWDGKMGPGPLNADVASQRAMTLAREQGIGCVGLRNTNHWMRGGYFGWQAAEAGQAMIAWTNTKPNVPPWGAVDVRVGNNPLVLAVPKNEGPVVLDMAMSQFSFGRMEGAARSGQALSLVGGFDSNGELTTDPAAIIAANRALPIGYWKGSGLALLLDMIAALVAGGQATHQIGQQVTEYAVSQVFIAFDLAKSGSGALVKQAADEIIADLHGATPVADGTILYPGERALQTREENLAHGIPVEPEIWEQVLALA